MVIITAAFPFVPAELNIAHFASTYVPADIYKRLLTVSGEGAQLVCATDYHSIYASQDGKTTDMELCRRFHQKYLALFEKMNIHFEQYITTNEEEHQDNVRRVFTELLQKQLVYLKEAADWVCSNCGCHLPKRFTGDDDEKKCEFCGSMEISEVKKNHYFLKTTGEEEPIKVFAEKIKQTDIRNMVLQYVNNGFQDWNFTRYNQLGVAVPDSDEQSFYIWFDSLVGYDSLINRCGGYAEKVIHFIGKNIVYYHSVVWPIIFYKGIEGTAELNVSARGFLDLGKTDTDLLDLTELTEQIDADFVRFYLAFKVKDNISDYCFSREDLEKIVDFYCCKKMGGFFYKVWRVISQNPESAGGQIEVKDLMERSEWFVKEVEREIEEFRVHEVLKKTLDQIDFVNAWMNKQEKVIFQWKQVRDYLMQETAQLLCIVSAFMPELVKQYSIFEDWVPKTLQDARAYEVHPLKKEKEKIKRYV